jgi:phospholipid/cholesterol/gamma-HCH transport system ATP-binding protein
VNVPQPVESTEQAKDLDETVVEVRDLCKEFSGRMVTNGVSFKVYRGDTMIIMGASGCGKSTLLRQIIGSIKPTSGSIKSLAKRLPE